MKKEEQVKSVELRKDGMSLNEIASKLNVSKSSVSLWVRNIELTAAQRKKLSKNILA